MAELQNAFTLDFIGGSELYNNNKMNLTYYYKSQNNIN